jgi:hypothetical protein
MRRIFKCSFLIFSIVANIIITAILYLPCAVQKSDKF